MVKRKKYLFEPKPGYIYVRIKGKYLGRITAPEGTPEFDSQYWALVTGKAQAAKTSWAALIKSYRASARWAALKLRTRQFYERVFEYFEEKNGPKDMRSLRRKDVIAGQQANAHRVRFANAIPAVLSVLCEHAIDLGWIDRNPAKGVRKLETPKEKQRPHVPWTDAAVAKWRAEAAPLPLLIFELGVGTVQRPSDLIAFRWGDYDGASLGLVQSKTGKVLRKLPCTPQLKAALDRAKEAVGGAPHPNRTIICGAWRAADLFGPVAGDAQGTGAAWHPRA